MDQIRVAAVSYLNTKPLLFGIRRHPVMEQVILLEDYPANIARMLLNDEVDLALIPVAVIPKLPNAYLVTDYCIGADGPVASVCIFSDVPLNQVKEVYLDYQSRTSVALAKLLLRDYWKMDVRLLDATGEDYRDRIKGTTAGVVIGDRALEQRLRSAYTYDLAEAWIQHTGLPFVFAAWVANKNLPAEFLKAFNEACAQGIQHITDVVRAHPYHLYDLNTYFGKNISYNFDMNKRKGLELFLKTLEQ